ncbi:MAG: hypothetical protein R3F37_16800 [Candidatus Competibacteraceae bacterium]
MSSADSTSSVAPAGTQPGFIGRFLRREFPYIILIVLALIGIAYTDIAPTRAGLYWQELALVYGVLAVVTDWSQATARVGGRVRLIWTQILHWGAFFVTMRLVFLPVMQENLNSDVTGLVLLFLLTLSTFLAGIYINLRLCVVAVFLGAGAVSIALLDQASLLMTLLAALAVVGLMVWTRYKSS